MITKKDILVITTGGTIDSHYDPAKGTPRIVPQDAGSAVPSAIEHLGLDARCRIHELCVRDSKQITPSDMYRMLALMKGGFDKIIITQGTDAMPANARKLEAMMHKQGITGKTVVFTGAMEPLRDDKFEVRPQADGWGNLKRAFEAVDHQPLGVYVAMNDMCRPAQDVSKRVVSEGEKVIDSGFVDRVIRSSERVDQEIIR